MPRPIDLGVHVAIATKQTIVVEIGKARAPSPGRGAHIQVAIAIVVGEDAVRAPPGISAARPASGIRERPVHIVANEHMRAECSHVGSGLVAAFIREAAHRCMTAAPRGAS